jgi:hypothetical protein
MCLITNPRHAVFAECANAELVKEPTQAMGLPAEDIKPLVHPAVLQVSLCGLGVDVRGSEQGGKKLEVRP